jgi:O-antigen/teichoic acid export membrane protein
MTDDIEALAKGGRTNVGGFMIRLIARIPFLFIAGQWYGAEALGRLAYAIIVVEFGAQLATMGLKRGLALHLSASERGDKGVWDALLIALTAAMPPMLLMMLVPRIMFPNSEVNGLELLLPLVVPALALVELMLAALAYRYDVGATVRARAIVEPWTISIAAFALSWYSLRDGLLMAYGLSIAAAFVAALIPFLRSYGTPRGWRLDPLCLYQLTRRNLPLAAADAVEWGSRRLDLAILGLFVSPATVGIYYVAQQVASLPQKLKTSFDPILGPVITRKIAEKDLPGIAAQIGQVGFWILAAQAGIALALGIPGEALMDLFGKGREFVGGQGALSFLLLAEVVASTAVVSEAALVYVARYRNFLLSLATIALQAGLSFALILAVREAGFNELYQAAGAALALVLALGFASLAKSRLAARVLGAPVRTWRWKILLAAVPAALVGATVWALPPAWQPALGVPLILFLFCLIAWRMVFTEADRRLFRKAAEIEDQPASA